MAEAPDSRSSSNELAREIDKLLKQLPGADPFLRGDPEPPSVSRGPVAKPAASAPKPEPSRLAQQLSAWVRLLLVAGLAFAITQWPYARECGWPLRLYLGAVGTILLGGSWAAVWAWRVRSASAHVVALIVIFWGVVLSAEQVLPRIGYAATQSEWRCEAP